MMTISKTDETVKLEREIYFSTRKMGTFGCFEVTIGFGGNERVDYITYDTKGVWRCFEIKVSTADFYRGRKPTFVGHYNYYVLTKELYEQVRGDIPSGIGVYLGNYCKKRASRQSLKVDEGVLKDSMIRSLYREFDKQYIDDVPHVVENMKRRLKRTEDELFQSRRRERELMMIGYEKYGRGWHLEENK